MILAIFFENNFAFIWLENRPETYNLITDGSQNFNSSKNVDLVILFLIIFWFLGIIMRWLLKQSYRVGHELIQLQAL